MNPIQTTPFHKQKGISLLSLMIASAIGIFLTGAAIKVYVDSKMTFRTRNVVSEVVENQRFALDEMRRILVMAGRDIRQAEESFNNSKTFPDITTSSSDAVKKENEYIFDGGTDAPDVVAVRYRAGPSCAAYQNVPIKGKQQKRTNGTIYRDDKTCRPTTVRFKVVDNELICEMKRYYTRNDAKGLTSCLATPVAITESVLVSGVETLKVLYGVDDDNDGYASRYLTASQVTNWQDVVTLRFGLVVGSESTLPVSARKASTETVDILGMSYDEPDTEHLYRAATATLSLRNFNTVVQRQ